MALALRRYLPPLLGAVLFLAALYVLRGELSGERFFQLRVELARLDTAAIAASILLTALSYLVLSAYDALALHFIRRPLPVHRTMLTSFIAFAFSHSIGFPLLSGGGVRYRLYSSWGLSATEVALVTGFSTLTLIVGVTAIMGVASLLQPAVVGPLFGLPPAVAASIGAVLVALTLAYVLLGGLLRRTVPIAGVPVTLPRPPLALAQVVVSALDWMVAAAVLYVLLPAVALPSFPAFVVLFTVAACAGLVSNVPGGLGVFESIMLLALPSEATAAVLAALVVWRAVYYILPLAAGALLLGGYELLSRWALVSRLGASIGNGWRLLAPNVFAVLVFIAGSMLLVSTAVPAAAARLRSLYGLVPIGVIEISHFLASLVGMALLIVAWGLRRRLDAAWLATVALLGAGAVLALLKGLRVEQAAVMTLLLLLLLPCRAAFYRKAHLTGHHLSLSWLLAVAMVVVGVIGAGLFVYGHVEYRDELWWSFALRADAPRFLRASAGALAVLLLLGLGHLLRAARARAPRPSAEAIERARPIVRTASSTLAHLALSGDKALLFSESGQSLLMYVIEGRSWVAIGDPIGPEDERLELVWRFRELCDEYEGWPVFYDVSAESFPLYLELGLAFQKLGEQALVPLNRFDLEGRGMRELRRRHQQLLRDGHELELLGAEQAASILPLLERIADDWSTTRAARGAASQAGGLDPGHLADVPIALVRRAGEIVAFANLWATGDRSELSVELIRHTHTAARHVLDFLLVELMLHGRRAGYARFDLGLAPFAGPDSGPLAPLWSRAGPALFRHGEHFDDIEAVRLHKAMFEPLWVPRYLASPGGFALPRVLRDLASLIARADKGSRTFS